MKKGCLIGCFAVSFLFTALAVIALIAGQAFFNIFTPAARVDLVSIYGDDHAVTIFIDPNEPGMADLAGDVVQQDSWLVQWFVPHEILLFWDATTEPARKDFTLAISTRRFGGLASWLLPIPKDSLLFGDLTVNDISVQDNGVVIVRAGSELPEETLAEAAAFPVRTDVSPLELEGGHNVEILFNNHGGQALLALSRYVRDLGDAESGDAVLTNEEASGLLRSVLQSRITGDSTDGNSFQFLLKASCVDEAGAATAYAALQKIQEYLKKEIEKGSTSTTSRIEQQGSELIGEFVISGRYTGTATVEITPD